jgi:hypothetical protein
MEDYNIEPIPNLQHEGVEDLLREIYIELRTVEELVRHAKKPLPVILIEE